MFMLYVYIHRYVCSGGSYSPSPVDGVQGHICPTGHYCPLGSDVERGCGIGTYQDQVGQDACIDCPAGQMCHEVNMTSPVPCMEG